MHSILSQSGARRSPRLVPDLIRMLQHESGTNKRVVRTWQGTQERRNERDETERQMKGQLSELVSLIKSSVVQDASMRGQMGYRTKHTHNIYCIKSYVCQDNGQCVCVSHGNPLHQLLPLSSHYGVSIELVINSNSLIAHRVALIYGLCVCVLDSCVCVTARQTRGQKQA